MEYYNSNYFAIFMLLHFHMKIDKEQIGEELVLLYKEELDENLVSEDLLDTIPDRVLVHSCIYYDEDNEWIICVVSDTITNHPLILVCLKDGLKMYEQFFTE